MLHIHNGSSTANTMKEFGFPGQHLAFQEVLTEGPTPADLSPEEWLKVRAKFLAQAYELKLENCEKDLGEQKAALEKFSEHEETILWFEHDLFCQINLIYLLDWFSKQSRNAARLSLVCIGEFPGKPDFRGLGELTGEQLASLFEQRHVVSGEEFHIASLAWAAYCAAIPQEITRLLEQDLSAMPFLEQALRLHLARFPSLKNGLGRIENNSLKIISNGALGFKSLFPQFAAIDHGYGMGDAQFWCVLKRLGEGTDPLVTISGIAPGELAFKSSRFHDARFELTETGRAVLAGERDFVEINGIDMWLGGVRLIADSVWRWDDANGLLVRSAMRQP